MAIEVRMPKLGMTMRNGTVVRWLKNEGEPVTKGEPLLEVMTEKITNEVEAPASGVLRRILVPADAEVPVGEVLAVIAEPAEADAPVLAVVEDGTPAEQKQRHFPASPSARRTAEEHGIDISLVKPAPGHERITREDVLAFVAARQQAETQAAEPPTPAPTPPPGTRAVPLAGMRKAIADHMVTSLQQTAQLTAAIEVDVTDLVRAREAMLPGFRLATDVRLTYTDLLIALVAKALGEHPLLNSTLEDGQIILHEDVHMGVAVALDDGLIVPVIRRAQALSLGEIARRRHDLQQRALAGRLEPDEVRGGTFTITNPGLPGADISTPILNSPQNAILGVGRFVKKPAVYRDEICVRHMCWLSLTIDHRALDGMPAARFLDTLGRLLQDPLAALGGA